MTTNKKMKKSFKPLLFFLISVLLHLIIILFLLKQKHWYRFPKDISVLITLDQDKPLDQKAPFEHKKEEPLNKKEEKIKEEHDLPPAKLSPRQSKFGVMWASESEIAPETMPKPQDIQQESAHAEELSSSILKDAKVSQDKPNFTPQTQPVLSSVAEADKPEKISTHSTPQQKIVTPTKKSSIKPLSQEEMLTTQTIPSDLWASDKSSSITTMLDDLSDDQARDLLKEYDALEQKLKQTDEQKTKNGNNQLQSAPQKKELAEPTSLLERIKSAMAEETATTSAPKATPKQFTYQPVPAQPSQQLPKNNKKNLIAMTQGFIENIKNTGSDWLEQDGVERALTNDELKYISYEQQVSWFLQASWKRHFANKTHFTGKLNVRFLLDAQGNVSNVKVINSSGNTFLDDMVIKSIKIAAPFPPLPKYFEKTEYQVSRNIYVS